MDRDRTNGHEPGAQMSRALYEAMQERNAEQDTALAYRPIAPQRQMMRDSVGIVRSLWGVARAWLRERRTIRARRHDAGR